MGLFVVCPSVVHADTSQASVGGYQVLGIDRNNLPVFYQRLKDKLTFPLSWNSGKYTNFNIWRKTARNKVMEQILAFPDCTPFTPRVIDEQDQGSYIARKVAFNISAESRVLALMLVPKGKGPFPAVLLLHDHGAKFDIGKEKMIAPWGDEVKSRSAKSWSDKYFSGRFIGNELAAHGYVVLAVDALGWGDRGGIKYESQQALASNLLSMGTSLAGLVAYEDIRSADFLASLPEVDKSRVGAMGFSMGAYRAWQVAALADSIKVGVAVCWMTTTKSVMVPGNNMLRGQSSFYTMIPGVVNYLDYPDVASIAAPKPMLFYNGDADELFPIDSVKEAYRQMHQVWQSQRADDKLKTKIWPSLGHLFVREEQEEAFQWLDSWLNPRVH
ncbi:dienelactone hydrolase family protein [Pelosinus propionicus]|uniref:Abhydrolase family protein n=1 Tax=Pelosinus propionicus DSM 13327 TaxID=1123291 RepID=A0A1I4JWV1_9FIRM|nr:alpha/beta fold hydrolase [Pelosinus propionicus]SFL70677.1 Abhydrolase family protein [Pelosinus propionicus DSM 13327]